MDFQVIRKMSRMTPLLQACISGQMVVTPIKMENTREVAGLGQINSCFFSLIISLYSNLTIKIRNQHQYITVIESSCSIQVSLIVPISSFIAKGFNPGSCIAFYCHMSATRFSLKQFPSHSWSSMALKHFKIIGKLFSRRSFFGVCLLFPHD